jgi:hypothetical protein
VRKFLSCLLVFTVLLCQVNIARAAAAAEEPSASSVTSKRLKIVAKSALYGFGGGLVVGLASQVFKKNTKNIFMFGSLGMYAGILLGIYVISTSAGPAPYEGPDTYEDFSSYNKFAPPANLLMAKTEQRPELKLNLVNVKF